MGRNRIREEQRIEHITIVLPRELIDKIKAQPSYNMIIRKLLEEYFRKNE